MLTIEIKHDGREVAAIPAAESMLRELALESGACTRTFGGDEHSGAAKGFSVRLHRDPGSDWVAVTVHSNDESLAEMHVSNEGLRDLLDAGSTAFFVSCGYDEMKAGGRGHGYSVAFARPKPWLSA